MSHVWQPLFVNLALISVIMVAWDMISDATQRFSARTQSLLLGAVMGAGAVASMATAQTLMPGVIFDLRAPVIASAAFFGGLPAALVSVAASVAYRVFLGGQGTLPGIVGILVAGAIGYAFHRITLARQRTMLLILGFSVAVAAGSVMSLLTLPSSIMANFIAQTWLPLLLLTFLGCMLIGILLDRQFRRIELINANIIYRAMVRELPDCLNAKDTSGKFIAANPATAALMGAASAEDLIGRTDFDFYPPDLAAGFRRDEDAVLRSGEILRVEQQVIFPDGASGWLSTLKVPFRDDSGDVAGIVTYNRDITELKRSAELKDEFISTVSHELRTPLTAIRGALGLVVGGDTGGLPPKTGRMIQIAHANSERLAELVNDILDLEKIESGKMKFALKRLPLRPIIDQAITANSDYLPERRINIVLVDDAPGAESVVDPDRLHQVLSNLLSNAVKFSPVGGTVTVRLEQLEDGRLRISFRDRGSGIPESFRGRIFGKFEQADATNTRTTGGTGLGLNIVKSIVERLGGEISFESEVGEGATFNVDLPGAGSRTLPSLRAVHDAGSDRV